MLYVHSGRKSALEAFVQVVRELEKANVQAVLTLEQKEEILSTEASLMPPELTEILASGRVIFTDLTDPKLELELVMVLGGDGTILRALEVTYADVPLHGVNLGHVGFLAESEVSQLDATVSRLVNRDYALEHRSALKVKVFDTNSNLIAQNWALNEASLEKADRQRMIEVVVGIDSRPVSEFGCDGVLLSTPTGSTAYAFSAGGPVMWPEVDALLVIPVAAHALFARPLILGRSSKVEIEVSPHSPAPAVLTLDGRRTIELQPGWRIEGKLSSKSISFARFAETPFADRLVNKFQLPVQGWRGSSKGAKG